MAYSKKVIEKFENTLKNPSAFNVGRLDPKKKNVGTGMVGAPACGDVMRLQIEVINAKDKDIAKILELPPIKIHCSVLAEDSIKQAIADYESKKA